MMLGPPLDLLAGFGGLYLELNEDFVPGAGAIFYPSLAGNWAQLDNAK
jgi:hypothetical protein